MFIILPNAFYQMNRDQMKGSQNTQGIALIRAVLFIYHTKTIVVLQSSYSLLKWWHRNFKKVCSCFAVKSQCIVILKSKTFIAVIKLSCLILVVFIIVMIMSDYKKCFYFVMKVNLMTIIIIFNANVFLFSFFKFIMFFQKIWKIFWS